MAAVEACVVVVDGANVACQKDGKVHIPKLVAAIQYFCSLEKASGRNPIKCVAFAPNFWLNVKPTPGIAAFREKNGIEMDDWTLLSSLVQKDLVILTPSQAHDDYYVIEYAVKYDGYVVTNDMFRDHVANKRTFQGKKLTSDWVRSHCIDFTFVGEEFLPNPRAMERIHNFQPSTLESLPSSSLSIANLSPLSVQKSLLKNENELGDVDEAGMVVDYAGTKRSKNIDLSEVTYYKFPRELLPMLHGDDGETMSKFQEHTGTYIVLPSYAASSSPSTSSSSLTRPQSSVSTLSIYGTEGGRQQAVHHLDEFLFQMQQHAQYTHQQQQQHYMSQINPSEWVLQQHAARTGTQEDCTMEIDP